MVQVQIIQNEVAETTRIDAINAFVHAVKAARGGSDKGCESVPKNKIKYISSNNSGSNPGH